jgi:tetratricopeptide (TPR) repeat protein
MENIMKSKNIFIYIAMVMGFSIGVYILINKINGTHIPDLNPRSGDSNLSAEFLNAQRAVSYYREQIEENPDKIQNYIELAQIFMQEARIAGDHHEYIKDALSLIDEALNRQPENFEAIVTKASLQMTLHQFKQAKALIEKAIKINNFNAAAYGVLCDANVELGQYDEAVKACDKMLSIRPDLRSYSRASYLREIHGEKQAAIEAMLLASNAGVSGQENRAWALYNLGKMLIEQGKLDSAKFIFEGILEERPNYPYALSGLANIYGVKKEHRKSIELLEKAFSYVQDHSFFEQIADFYQLIGYKEKQEEFIDKALFEFDEHERDGWNVNHEYAVFCLNHNINLNESLERAKKDYEFRPINIDALDTYAWALHKNGKSKEAVKYIEQAMRLNTNRGIMLYHAGMIYNSVGEKNLSEKYLQLALKQNPSIFPLYAENASKVLASKVNVIVN